jgi:hypothetical protein
MYGLDQQVADSAAGDKQPGTCGDAVLQIIEWPGDIIPVEKIQDERFKINQLRVVGLHR